MVNLNRFTLRKCVLRVSLSRLESSSVSGYKDGSLSDITTFNKDHGIIWKMTGGRQRTEKDLMTWQGKRGGVGRMVPNGFPRPPRFN